MDLLIGVIIFMSMAVFLYITFLTGVGQNTEFTNEADLLLRGLDASNFPEQYNNSPVPLRGYSVDRTELGGLYTSEYNTIRSQLGVDSHVCVYITDSDGNLVGIEDEDGGNVFSIGEGTEDIMIADGLPC